MAALLVGTSTAPAHAADTDPFTIVLIPDTQNYTYSNRTAILNSQMDWVVASRESLNTVFVAHLGDLVSEYTSANQWQIISDAMKRLDDATVPNTVIPGNHDFNNSTRAFGQYDTYFPVSRYAQASWNSQNVQYGGYLGQGQFGPDPVDRQNMNSYALLTAGGHSFLLLNLEFEAPDYAQAWADRVLAAHPDRTVILVTHSFIRTDGSRRTAAESSGGTSQTRLWSEFVSARCQIRMVLSGHEHIGDLGEARRTDNNSCGQPVHQMLSDYQSRPNGGDGWLRYLTFDPVAGIVSARTYSSYLDQFETDTSSEFSLPFSLDGSPSANIPPVAGIAVLSISGHTASLSGAASSDIDGTIASYAWDFGDTATATGSTASHTYESAGTYTVRLTVTDDDGATHSATTAITVEDPPPPAAVLAADSFTRTTTNGWGTATTGGPWTIPTGAAQFSVDGDQGIVTLSPGQTREARLASISNSDTTTDIKVATNLIPTGGAASATIIGRLAPNGDNYATRVRFEPNGVLRLYLLRGETSLNGGGYVVPGGYLANQQVNVRLAVTGTNPTTVQAKIWKIGTPEPTSWQAQATDSTPTLQAPGIITLRTALSSSVTTPTIKVAYDDLTVTSDDTPPPPPPENQPPTARFTTNTNNLTVTVNGTTSTDPDGTITTYAWNFGDTATATGSTASHTYTTPGSYTITLTVTDNQGATHTTTHTTTVENPPPPPPAGILAADSFTRTTTNGWGTATTGGPWTVLWGTANLLSVDGSQGVMALGPGQTREARLNTTSATDAEVTITFSSDLPAIGGAASITLIGREVGNSTYSARARLEPGGGMRMYLLRDETALGSYVLPGSYVVGEQLRLKVSVTGSSPTVLRGKLWRATSIEPAAWQTIGADSAPGMQAAGRLGVKASISGSSTVAVTRLKFDDLEATTP